MQLHSKIYKYIIVPEGLSTILNDGGVERGEGMSTRWIFQRIVTLGVGDGG